MTKYCKFTGVELTDENPIAIKKMCLNCKSIIDNLDGTYSCIKESVMQKGREKILAAVPDGFEIDTLTLKPMSLKNPTKKCGAYDVDMAMLHIELDAVMAQ
jgi:hypothetical protein